MKKHNRIIKIIMGVLILSSLTLVGCSTSRPNKPEDIIKDAYDGEEFTISFNVDDVDNPIPSIKYSAKNMPKLPIPERVGYIFSGWYLDKNYVTPYTDNILYLYMKDITLYAKWEKEEFLQEGVYDLKLSVKIDEILSKGELADSYPMNDIARDIDYDECCIEKSEAGLQLKLQYTTDIKDTNGSPIYSITQSKQMGDKIHLVEKIAPDNSETKTYYYNIDKLDISKPIYFDVISTYNADVNMSDADRVKTRVNYRIEVKIDKLIGFSRPFVDTSVPLDKNSYYLVKTHYNSMAESYNPVYSYISVDNDGNYTLIKPFMPYSGLIGSGMREDYLENFYHRGMSFSPMQVYYRTNPDKDYTKEELEKAEYLPELVNGGYYGAYTVEFHADSGKYYMIYDLGKHLDGEFIISGATTGIMEMMSAMGRYDIKMTLDFDHIIKLADIDYKPLKGDAYVYNDEIQYYPGNQNDLNQRNLIKDNMDAYGISTNMFNYYYSADFIDSPIENRKIHSHKYTVVPSSNTAARTTKESRYQIASFNLTTRVYDYDPANDGKLFGDSMSVNNFGGSGRREHLEILTGKMLRPNDELRLDSLFKEKVNPNVDFERVRANIYSLENNTINYASKELVDDIRIAYTFTKPVAIEYSYKENGSSFSTIVYLKEYQAPSYQDNHKVNGYKQFDDIEFYDLSYSWGENSKRFKGNYYVEEPKPTYDPIYMAVIGVSDGIYSASYLYNYSKSFNLNNLTMYVAYELNNEFREVQMLYLEYNAKKDEGFKITCEGNVVHSGRLFYEENGDRKPVGNYINYTKEINDLAKVNEFLSKSYKLEIGSNSSELLLESVEIKNSTGTHYIYDDFIVKATELLNNDSYGVLTATFSNGFDTYRDQLTYNIKIDGKNNFELFNQDKLFTGYNYIFNSPKCILPNDVVVDNIKIDIRGSSSNDRYILSEQNGLYSLSFITPGEYLVMCRLKLDYDVNGDRVLNGETMDILLSQRIEVVDTKKDVSITYVTDKEHPFKEDIEYKTDFIDGKEVYTYTVNQLITDDIVTLNQIDYFSTTSDGLYAWSPRPWSEYTIVDASRMTGSGERVGNAIELFGTNNIVMYSIWDKGINVHIDMSTAITGQASYDEHLRLDNDIYKGYYVVIPPTKQNVFVPKGYIFTGWTVVETGEFYREFGNTRILTRTEITVKATFIQDLTIRFDVDTKFGSGVTSQHVWENNKIKQPTVNCKDGYKLVGFRLATGFDKYGRVTEISNVNFDFSNPITADLVNYKAGLTSIVVFVAVFEDVNGNEVWQEVGI